MLESALLKPRLNHLLPTVSHGQGVTLWDTQGREYLDGSSGAMTANLGHGRRDVAAAAYAQACKVAFSYRTQFTNQPAEKLASALADIAPGELNWAFFVNSGSEASEYAIRLVGNYWREQGQPNKVKVLGRHNSYHGMTMGAMSISGHAARRTDYGPLLHPFAVAPPVHQYRYGLPGESEENYIERAVAEVEQAILLENPSTVAAFIAEPIVGAAGGALVPPRGYFTKLRQVCDRHDVLLIVDEVITGMGRTGDWFASIYEDIVPDLMLLGKGLSAGYFPMAGILIQERLVASIRSGTGVPPFGHTFSATPLGAATCLAVLEAMAAEDIMANARKRGVELESGLHELANQYKCIDDVRGRGLLWGFEFVTESTESRPVTPASGMSSVFVETCRSQGLIVYPAGIAPLDNAIIVAPPLTITSSEVHKVLERLDASLKSTDIFVKQ